MAQFTFVTAMSVQACLHAGYRNEPNKIEKGQLCQKLTYSQQPTGGGRVLSVILAGTLAMGMTPAVALTTQSLEPMQAFAASVPPQDWSNTSVAVPSDYSASYTGAAVNLPASVVSENGSTITSGFDLKYYTSTGDLINAGDIKNAGTYTVQAVKPAVGTEGQEGYEAPKYSATDTFTVSPCSIANATIDATAVTNGMTLDQLAGAITIKPKDSSIAAVTLTAAGFTLTDADYSNTSTSPQEITLTAGQGSNYESGTYTVTLPAASETEADISSAMKVALGTDVAASTKYTGNVIPTPAVNVTAEIDNVPVTIPSSAYTVSVQQGGQNAQLLNAGDYTLVVTLNEGAEVNGQKVTGSAEFAGNYTIAKAPLNIEAPQYIPAGTTMENAAKMFKVTGVVPADASKADEIYAVAAANNNTQNDAAVGDTITGTVSIKNDQALPGSNYTVGTATATADVPKAITINNVSYAVSLAPNDKRPNVTSATSFDYSYNTEAQAPKVVFTNMTTGKEEAQPAGVTVLYAAETATPGTYADGTITPRAAVGNYKITVEYGSGATKQSVNAGTYKITAASLNDSAEVLVTWNGAPVNQTGGASTSVSLNNPDQWANALKVVYPSNGVELVRNVEYTATFGTNTLTIGQAAPSSPGMVVPVTCTKFDLTYTLANYQIGSAAMSADFLKTNPTYKNAQIAAVAGDVVVKNAAGVVVPQLSVYYSTNQNGPWNNPAEKDLPQNATDGMTLPSETVTVGTGASATQETRYYKVMKNWDITNGANKNAGEATVTITGANNYAGEATATFTIAPRNVADLVLNVVGAGFVYDAEAQTPDVQVTAANTTVTGLNQTVKAVDNKSTDFTVSYSNNTNATSATSPAVATITAASANYTGSKTVNFEIAPYDITGVGKTTAANLPFTTNTAAYNADILTVTSGLKIKDVAVPMTANTDYKVVQNTGKGNATSQPWTDLGFSDDVAGEQEELHYAIVGQGNYKGTIYGDYYVTENSIGNYIKAASAPIQYFDGTELEPDITITLSEGAPFIGTDEALAAAGLTVTYANNRNASTQATFTISASGATSSNDPNVTPVAYYGSWPTRNFTILPSDLTDATFALLAPETGAQFEYTGSQIKPVVSVDPKETAPLYAGAGIGQTRGILTTAQGTQIKLENIEGEYVVSYGANTTVGKKSGSVTLTSTSGNLTNASTETFAIVAATITEDDVTVSDKGVYKVQANGATFAEPDKVTVTVNDRVLVRDVDYTLTVGNNQKVGDPSSWVITGIGNYTGSVSGTFQVVNDIATADITMPNETYTYDGTAKEPLPTVTIKSGNDTTILKLNDQYELDYENNVNAGTATVIIKGIGDDWGGEVKKTFTIAQAQGDLAITGAVADYTYTGAAATPEPDFTFTVGTTVYKKTDLTAGTDYKYVYANNIDATAVTGKKATVGVQMIGNYGAKDNGAVEFTIAQANVASANVVVSDVTVGKTPKVAVTMGDRALTEGKDFTFAADTKTPGQKTATITGIGNYTGTQKVTFTVLNDNQVPADDANLTGGTWKKANGQWQYITKDGKLVSSGWAKINGKDYYFDSKGNAQTGWLEDGGKWYYLYTAADKGQTECSMATGWASIGGEWYYFNKWGAMTTGWQKVAGTWYYMDKWGHMTTGWQQVGGYWYYMNQWGHMTTGWQQIGGSWYYLNGNGAMAANTWVGNYYVDASGRWVR